MRTASFEGPYGQAHDAMMEIQHLQMFDSPGKGHRTRTLALYDARRVRDGLEAAVGQFVRDLGPRRDESPSRLTSWLRGIVIAPSQSSDQLALNLWASGVLLVAHPSLEEPATQIGEAVLQQLQKFQDATAPEPPATFSEKTARDPSATRTPSGSGESPFSRAPSYFEPELYNDWLGKLSQPWNSQDPWDSES